MRIQILMLMLYVSLSHAMNEENNSKTKVETNTEETRPEHAPLREIRYYGRNREFLIRPLPFFRMLKDIQYVPSMSKKEEKK